MLLLHYQTSRVEINANYPHPSENKYFDSKFIHSCFNGMQSLYLTFSILGNCQFPGMMENPALMMSMMRGMGAMGAAGGMGVPMMDMNSAPVMDPKMFAKMAKFAALMGPSTTGTATKSKISMKGKAAKKSKKVQTPSPGIDPLMMYTMMQQGGQIDPLMMMLMSSPKSAQAQSGSSGGMDPMLMMYMMQQVIFITLFVKNQKVTFVKS